MMKFSIILPTFNRDNMVKVSIKSVISQSFKDWELIVVDDGSTDNTKEIVEEFVKLDKRIKYIFQENKERSAARNNGIKKAKGDWICFLDSDDIYHTNHLEEFKQLIEKTNKKEALYISGVSYGEYSEDLEEYNMSHNNNLEFVLLNTIGTPRACVSKQILIKYKFNEVIKIGEDKELWSRISQFYPVIFHKKKTFIELEHRGRSINNIKNKLEHLKTTKFILNKLTTSKKIKRKVLSDSYFSVSKYYLYNNSKINALRFILLSLFIDISNTQSTHKIYICLSLLFLTVPKEYNR